MENLVFTLKRVISEPDNAGRQEITQQQLQDANYLANQQHQYQSPANDAFPVTVEMDDPMEEDSIEARNSTHSSLTDHEHLYENYHQQQQQQQHYQHYVVQQRLYHTMRRNDSHDSSVSSSGRTSKNGSGNWGWFEDVHDNSRVPKQTGSDSQAMPADEKEAAMAVTAPNYVLEESLSSQKLWKNTAGNRPPQPVEERAFYEKMWTQNFAKSQVAYGMPVEVLTAASPISLSPFADGNFQTQLSTYEIAEDSKNQATDQAEAALVDRMSSNSQDYGNKEPRHIVVNRQVRGPGCDSSMTVLVRGDNVFGTTVSKSFALQSEKGGPIEGVDTVNISVASYRVIQSKKHGKFAQYLVIYREGSIRDTIGVWKRYSDFAELSRKVTHEYESCVSVLAKVSPLAITEEHEVEHLPNAITSWRLLKKRQRWYRCLDAGYLSLKVFLLERFLHDILFESTSPSLLREFVGAENFDGESISSTQSL